MDEKRIVHDNTVVQVCSNVISDLELQRIRVQSFLDSRRSQYIPNYKRVEILKLLDEIFMMKRIFVRTFGNYIAP